MAECGKLAVVWDIGRGKKQLEFEANDSAFVCHGRYRGRIASAHWDWDRTGVGVKLRDAGNGVLISNELFKVTGVGTTRLSPDGRFLAIGRRSENPIECGRWQECSTIPIFSRLSLITPLLSNQ